MSLLREIVWRWQRASAYVWDKDGIWVAYPIDRWCEWSGDVPRRTLERWLKLLDDNGLIEREVHRLAGTTTCAFLRPTELTLRHLSKASDLDRLLARLKVSRSFKEKQHIGTTNDIPDGTTNDIPDGTTNGGTGGVTDHTSFPSLSAYSSTQKGSFAHAHAGPKGKAGEKAKQKLKLKKKKPSFAKSPEPATSSDDNDEIAVLLEIKKQKLEKLLAKFPILTGAHKNYVWHPYQKHGEKWATWSHKLIAERYAVYKQMVENWYKGKTGMTYKPLSYDDADFEIDLDFPDIEELLFGK